jgi:cyclohexadieny/prephenate dehydrogenase
MLFKKISIIGFGLIGSSLARVIREKNLARKIVAIDSSPEARKTIFELGLADEITADLKGGVRNADLVIICTPIGAYADIAATICDAMKEGAILTDVGSVKTKVVEDVSPHLTDNIHFVPAHPIAGTENSGPQSGFAGLFKDRWCILTPLPETDIKAVESVTAFWEACGSTIELMDYRRHDLILAITSHLPHLIAYTIVGTAADLEDDTKDDVIRFSASGFRDFTRIAASDPVMWRDVFLNNKEAVLEILQRFNEDLTGLQRAIRKGDGETLLHMFDRTRGIRRQIIDAGQSQYATASGQREAMPLSTAPDTMSDSQSSS